MTNNMMAASVSRCTVTAVNVLRNFNYSFHQYSCLLYLDSTCPLIVPLFTCGPVRTGYVVSTDGVNFVSARSTVLGPNSFINMSIKTGRMMLHSCFILVIWETLTNSVDR